MAAIDQLPNTADEQRQFRNQIYEVVSRSAQARIHLFSSADNQLPTPFLVLLVLWLAIIFMNYSILGEINPTVMVFVSLFALSSAGALFLIAELNLPFSGLLKLRQIQISQALPPYRDDPPLRQADRNDGGAARSPRPHSRLIVSHERPWWLGQNDVPEDDGHAVERI